MSLQTKDPLGSDPGFASHPTQVVADLGCGVVEREHIQTTPDFGNPAQDLDMSCCRHDLLDDPWIRSLGITTDRDVDHRTLAFRDGVENLTADGIAGI